MTDHKRNSSLSGNAKRESLLDHSGGAEIARMVTVYNYTPEAAAYELRTRKTGKPHGCQPTQAALAAWARRQGCSYSKRLEWGEVRIAMAGERDSDAGAFVPVSDWASDWLEVLGAVRSYAQHARAVAAAKADWLAEGAELVAFMAYVKERVGVAMLPTQAEACIANGVTAPEFVAQVRERLRTPKDGGAAVVRPASVVLWEGRSALDGAPIVVIATGLQRASRNVKTGAVVQTYILRSDVHPVDALASGADASICGDCKHRPQGGARTCYVDVAKSVSAVWRAYRAGSYPRVSAAEAAELLAGKRVRLGAYGDPAAAPFALWATVTAQAAGVTGYTHQWAVRRFSAFKALCMASTDSPAETEAAEASGWRVFEVMASGASVRRGKAFLCPSTVATAKPVTCSTCMACGGASSRNSASVAIYAHGIGAKAFELRAA